jgi:glycosyltransferase involved in cell wall biosynthesis
MFSLIVPTINRNTELFRLLHTLKVQTYKSFEIIIVDQNKNYILSEIDFMVEFSLNSVTVVKPELLLCASAARNFGAKYATGDTIAFPDDDCWYAEGILELVYDSFNKTKAPIISGGSTDPEFGISNANFLRTTKFIDSNQDIPLAGIEYSVFMYKSIFYEFKFDENISLSSKGMYQSGEITDLLFFTFKRGYQVYIPHI